MSGYATHLLIGAVGGLALTHLLPETVEPTIGGMLLSTTQEGLIVLASAVAATWPDVDEPHSFAGQRVRWTLTILTGLLLALVGFSLSSRLPLPPDLPPITAPLAGIASGIALGMGLIGPLLGTLTLRLVRTIAGGHRRLTHSLCLSIPLAVLAVVCWWQGWTVAALVGGLLAWGQWLHMLGDLVTVLGVPLLYPASDRAVRVLPRPLTAIGEPLIAAVALLLGGWLLIV